MKHFQPWLILAGACLLGGSGVVQAIDGPTAQQRFNALAASIADRKPWVEGGDLNPAQEQIYEQLKQQAAAIMGQPDREATLLALLNTYKDQDAYPRQAIMYTIIGDVNYTSDDVPFLKHVFLAAVDFHYDEYPYKERTWIGPIKTKTGLADRILGLSGRGHLFDNPEFFLLKRDPKAWLAKYAP